MNRIVVVAGLTLFAFVVVLTNTEKKSFAGHNGCHGYMLHSACCGCCCCVPHELLPCDGIPYPITPPLPPTDSPGTQTPTDSPDDALPIPPSAQFERGSVLSASIRTMQSRVWTDNTGRHQVEASLIGFVGSNVKLRRTSTGAMMTVPFHRLSTADKSFLAGSADVE